MDLALFLSAIHSVHCCSEETIVDFYKLILNNAEVLAKLSRNKELPKRYKTLKNKILKRVPSVKIDIDYSEVRNGQSFQKTLLEQDSFPVRSFKNKQKFTVKSVTTYVDTNDLSVFVKRLHSECMQDNECTFKDISISRKEIFEDTNDEGSEGLSAREQLSIMKISD